MTHEVFQTTAVLKGDEMMETSDETHQIKCVRDGVYIRRINGRAIRTKLMITAPVTRLSGYSGEALMYVPLEFNRLSQILGGMLYPIESEPLSYSLVVPTDQNTPDDEDNKFDFWKIADFHVGNCVRCFTIGYVGEPCPVCPGPVNPLCTRICAGRFCILPLQLARIFNQTAEDLCYLPHLTQGEVDAFASNTNPVQLDPQMLVAAMTDEDWNGLMPDVSKNTFLDNCRQRNERIQNGGIDRELLRDRTRGLQFRSMYEGREEEPEGQGPTNWWWPLGDEWERCSGIAEREGRLRILSDFRDIKYTDQHARLVHRAITRGWDWRSHAEVTVRDNGVYISHVEETVPGEEDEEYERRQEQVRREETEHLNASMHGSLLAAFGFTFGPAFKV